MLNKPLLSLQTKIALLVCVVVFLSLLVTDILIVDKVEESTQQGLAEKASTIASVVARTNIVIEGLSGEREIAELQAFADNIQKTTDVLFVVVIDMQGIRKSHPDPGKIGTHFSGGEGPALQGKEYTYIAKGPLGVSLRAFSPVYSANGKQVGAVAVGISLDYVQELVRKSRWNIYIGIGFGFLVGIIGALILANKIKKTLFGLEPFAIARLLEERSAVLQSVREGVLAVDRNSIITLANSEALRLLGRAGITDSLIGKKIENFIPSTGISEVIETGVPELDCELDLNGVTLVANRVPLRVNGHIIGVVSTFRDKTEIKQLVEQLSGVRNYAEALRAQAHEFMNKLHVILGMVHIKAYDQLLTYIGQVVHQQQAEVGFVIKHIKDPVLAGFLLGKLSYARELGIDFAVTDECFLPVPDNTDIIHELVTIIGNLLDNAFDAVKASSGQKVVSLCLFYNEGILNIEISDTGHGIGGGLQSKIFQKGFSTKADNRGFGLFLVQRTIEKLKGSMELFSEEGKGTKFILRLPYNVKHD